MSKALEIRPYREADEAAVVRLWRVVFPDDPPWNEPTLVIRRKLGVQPELFLVAVDDGCLVGTALAGFDGCRGWVHHVAVAPEARRARIGSRLVCQAAEGLRALGCPKVNLQVRAGNEAAVGFYASLGFDVEQRVSMAQLLEPHDTRPH